MTSGRHADFIAGRSRGRSRLALCLAVTAVTMAVELAAGLMTGSLALVSDAGHMLAHGFSLVISYIALRLAQRPADDRRTFGLYRAEIIAALLNGALLVAFTALIVRHAVHRLLDPVPIAAGWMLAVALVGLAVNLATALLLRSSAAGDLNIRSAFLHMLGDLVSSVVVVAGALVILRTGWNALDPLLSVFVCVLILAWAWRLIRESVEILLEATPRHLDIADVGRRLSAVRGVRLVHDIHVWSITSGLHAMSAHVRVDDMPISGTCGILGEIGEILRREFGISHYTIQFESGECVEHPVDHGGGAP
ncbi:MAG: cation diffusion facilitator family transporter [bacterium]|nr:cation diffusion facilitator family transporter [bacterium]